MVPNCFYGFTNTNVTEEKTKSGGIAVCFEGKLAIEKEDRKCPNCGNNKMYVNDHHITRLQSLSVGGDPTFLKFDKQQLVCPKCRSSHMQFVSFQARNHRITTQLETYAKELLSTGMYTLKQVAEITCLGKNVVKEIDKERLMEKYTVDGKELIKPEAQAKHLGIDEFSLHKGHQYATHIIDLDTGHVLWIANGKKKQVVFDFIDHVGIEWMKGVEAVACDMNADFEKAFKEKCEWITIVYDHFHIVKNFNDKVVNPVRIDEYKHLKEMGDKEGAASLKRCKYVLTSSRSTLERKDKEAREGKVISKGNALFNKAAITRT